MDGIRAQSCPILYDPMDCSPPGSSVHGIFQAGILEWVAISYFGGSAQPGIKLMFSALEGEFFTIGPPGKSQDNLTDMFKFLF